MTANLGQFLHQANREADGTGRSTAAKLMKRRSETEERSVNFIVVFSAAGFIAEAQSKENTNSNL